MQVLIVIFAIAIMAAIMAGAIWFAYYVKNLPGSNKSSPLTARAIRLPFRWRHILLPLILLFLSIAITAYFYHLLPEDVAYNLNPRVSPDKWLGRGAILSWMLVPQLCLVLVATGITWIITRLGILSGQEKDAWIRPEMILSIMGNMVAIPQVILAFAMLDIFSYNSYQFHIMPLWIFALIVMGAGVVMLGIFFILAIRQAWISNRQPQ